jgi:hypothetical protein
MGKLHLKTAIAGALLICSIGQTARADQMAIILNPAAAPVATSANDQGYSGVDGTTNIWTAAPAPWVARADGPYSIGQEFTTGSNPLLVSALGTTAWTETSGAGTGMTNMLQGVTGVPTTYQSGFVQVGLFQVGNPTPIATANVGSTGLRNGYFFQSIAPVTLAANTSYFMEAYVGNGIEWFLDGSDIGQSNWNGVYVPVAANNNLVDVTNGVFSTTVGSLAYPTYIFTPSDFSQNDPFRWGPANFLATAIVPEPGTILAMLSMVCTLGAVSAMRLARTCRNSVRHDDQLRRTGPAY